MLAAAVFFGFLNALWALFQWAELLLARQGGTPFCSVDETFNCTQVWDSAFAVMVHNGTQLPIAGWGLIWGVVATLIPLAMLANPSLSARGGAAALRLTALGGVASVAGLGTASAVAGALCLGCIGTYVLVAIWAFVSWKASAADGFTEAPRGLALAGGVAVVSFLVLLVPGMRTPHANADALALPTPGSAAATPKPTPSTTPPQGAKPGATTDLFDGPPIGDPARDDLLVAFMASLDGQAKQAMSDLLRDYRDTKVVPTPKTRALAFGDAKAPLKIVDWTDPLCPHCAMLHATLKEIGKSVPPGLFSVESRHFPLDGVCNSGVQRKSVDGTRCLGAKAQICLEGDPKAFEATEALFEARAETPEAVFAALKPFVAEAKLKACLADAATDEKLQVDIKAGLDLNIEGTPLLLMNGKEVRPFGPLVYALVLTGGADRHPAFKGLPPPRPKQPPGAGHEGHAH